MKVNVESYVTVTPRILHANRVQRVEIAPKFDFIRFNGAYTVSVFPRYRFRYDAGRGGAYYEPFRCTAEHGRLSFEYSFGSEQEYIIQVKPDQGGGINTRVVETSVYALEDDLYGLRVLKGDLHLHTTFSDGVESPEHRAMQARKAGFDFLAITDHNTYSGSVHLIEKMRACPNNMVFLRGEEVHATGCPVHILSLGASEAIAPKVTKPDAERSARLQAIAEQYQDTLDADVDRHAFAAAQDVFQKIREAGGMSVLCHIYWDAVDGGQHRRMGAPEQLIDALVRNRLFDAFEITSGAPAFDLKANYLQEIYYRENLPPNFPIIGITDSHSTLPAVSIFGQNYTIAFVEAQTEEGILEAIRNGRSVSVDGVGSNVICHGSLRLSKYAAFLREKYFPAHDEAVELEAELMLKILLGKLEYVSILEDVCRDDLQLLALEWGVISPK